jgi:adenylate cyclase
MKLYLLIIFSIAYFFVLGQNKTIDSLKNCLNSSIIDTNRVLTLLEIGNEYRNIDSQKSFKYLDEAYAMSKQLGYIRGMSTSRRIAGYNHYLNNNYKEAIRKYVDCFTLHENYPKILIKNKLDKIQLGNSFNIMGIILYYQADYEQALKYYNKCLEIFKPIEEKSGEANTYNNIGIVYHNLNDYSKALTYHFQSLAIKNEIDDMQGIAASYNNIGEVYRAQKNFRKAQNYYFKSLKIKEAEKGNKNMEQGISTACNNIGSIYIELGMADSAYIYLKRGTDISFGRGDKFDISESYLNMGKYYKFIKNFNKAIEFFNNALDLAEQIGAPELIKDASENISLAYAQSGMYREAYESYIRFKKISDELYNEDKIKKITQLEIQNVFDKKEEEKEYIQKQREIVQNAKMKRQSIISYASAIGFVLMLALLYVVYRNYNNKKKANLLLLKQKEELDFEKKKSDKLLLNVLPVQIAEELKRNGKAIARQYEHVSILFTDFKGFTKLCEQMSPIELINQLDEFFEVIDTIIEKNKIEKIKTAGDSYMCAGGVPDPNRSNPIDAVLTGLEIQAYMNSVNEKMSASNKPLWLLRVGIHTGNVVAGVIGKNKFAYDIWGDTVNVASRLEAACEPGKINISGDTHNFIRNYFECTYRGEIDAKNKGKVDMYFVDRLKPEYSKDDEGTTPNNKLLDIIRDINKK